MFSMSFHFEKIRTNLTVLSLSFSLHFSFLVSGCYGSKEVSQLWMKHSMDEKWQKLFKSLGLQDELDPEILASARARALHGRKGMEGTPETPPKTSDKRKFDAFQNPNTPQKSSSMPSRTHQYKPAAFAQPEQKQLFLKAPEKKLKQEIVVKKERGLDDPQQKSSLKRSAAAVDDESDLEIGSDNEDRLFFFDFLSEGTKAFCSQSVVGKRWKKHFAIL